MFCNPTVLPNHKFSHISNENLSKRANQRVRHTDDARIFGIPPAVTSLLRKILCKKSDLLGLIREDKGFGGKSTNNTHIEWRKRRTLGAPCFFTLATTTRKMKREAPKSKLKPSNSLSQIVSSKNNIKSHEDRAVNRASHGHR